MTQPGQVAVKYRRNVGSLSIDMSADNRTITLGRRIGQHIGRMSVDISTDARPICRPICRHIDRLSTDMSVDISTDTRPIYRPIYTSVENTIQYNDLLTTPHGGFSVTIQLRKITMISKKTKISSKTLYYVCMYV